MRNHTKRKMSVSIMRNVSLPDLMNIGAKGNGLPAPGQIFTS